MNYCPECGSQLDLDSKFCPNCGHALSEFTTSSVSNNNPPPTQYIPAQSHAQPRYTSQSQAQPRYTSRSQVQPHHYKESDTNGTIALIFGILGFFILPIIGSIIAIIFGAIARSRDRDSSTGRVGVVLGIIGILCWIIYFVAIFSMIFSMFNSYPNYY